MSALKVVQDKLAMRLLEPPADGALEGLSFLQCFTLKQLKEFLENTRILKI